VSGNTAFYHKYIPTTVTVGLLANVSRVKYKARDS